MASKGTNPANQRTDSFSKNKKRNSTKARSRSCLIVTEFELVTVFAQVTLIATLEAIIAVLQIIIGGWLVGVSQTY